jgi:hypothetical protein
MKIQMIYPVEGKISGNQVDVKRISDGLKLFGHDVRINESVKGFNPDIVHIFNAYKSRHGAEEARKTGAKLVVSMTGTDYNIYCKHISGVLKQADAIVFFCKESAPALDHNNQIVIRRGVPVLVNTDYKLKGRFIFSHIGGIRKVKNNIFAVRPLLALKKKYDFMLYFIGPAIEDDYYLKFKDAISGKDWIRYLGVVPRKNIKGVYQCTDVVLNTSLSEGNSNVLCEAHNLGKTVLASNIDGNKPLKPILYDNEDDFYTKAEQCLNGMKNQGEFCGNKNEIRQYDELYRRLLGVI